MLLIAYGLFIALVAYWPHPVDRSLRPRIDRVLAALHRRDLVEWFGYDQLEWSANLVFFVPLGLLLVLLLGGHRWWAAVMISVMVSCAIEAGQLLFLPARYATVEDLAANGLGALVGALFGASFLAVVHAKRRSRDRRARARLAS
jgi:VanZ family protein